MKLYKPDEGPAGDYIQDYGEEATLDDIKAYLADKGLTVVPLEPTIAMFDAGSEARLNNTSYVTAIYQAMIKAAGERE